MPIDIGSDEDRVLTTSERELPTLARAELMFSMARFVCEYASRSESELAA